MPDSTQQPLTDQAARERALDPGGSFIVQAPAGSGKTGLLIRRYLTLLATVNHPEEVIAVTFTRKAASEMRARVVAALHCAEDQAPDAPFERDLWTLAGEVLARDAARGWDILANPARLRIRTIDSLCAAIAHMAPWRGRLGGEANAVEDAETFYREAARELLEVLDDSGPWGDALARVLGFLDNDLIRFEATLVRLLARRDQWLRHVAREEGEGRDDPDDPNAHRQRMMDTLAGIVREELGNLRGLVPAGLREDILSVADYAGNNLSLTDPPSPIARLAGMGSLPGDSPEDMALWRGIAALLLTQSGAWRTRYTKNEGFLPAGKGTGADAVIAKEKKAEIKALMEALMEADGFRARLHGVRELPICDWDEEKWQVLDALMMVLRLAAASLRMVFARHGVVDFIEIAHGALAALGDGEAPSELALRLDYRIRHLLVDEFQDTSHTQVRLFSGLTAGWQPGDGRTLFLVGDPMQSIYRFREADVSLYLRARRFGIGDIPLTPLTLSANFRSTPAIVDWLNEAFPRVFPKIDDPGAGAVSFSPSYPGHRAAAGGEGEKEKGIAKVDAVASRMHPGVSFHPFRQDQGDREAIQVVALIRAAIAEDPAGSIAILVRSRNHLDRILIHLEAEGIPYRGVDLSPLHHRPVVRDLLSLTRALLHPGDRIAWLAVLRAPWCGVTLADLHALAGKDHEALLLEQWRAVAAREAADGPDPAPSLAEAPHTPFSADGTVRLARVFRVLEEAIRERGRSSLRTLVENAWRALGGCDCIAPEDEADAEAFLGLLETLEGDPGFVLEGGKIAERVARLYGTPEPAAHQVEIMTVHKAKGLEFDTVIVPSLGRRTRAADKPLLAWAEQPTGDGGFGLVLAPMPTPGEEADPVYRYLGIVEEKKASFEAARLLYVAATRARRRLHLLGHTRVAEDGKVHTPHRRSLLFSLWPVVSSVFTDRDAGHGGDAPEEELVGEARRDRPPLSSSVLWRLPVDWAPGELPPPLPWPAGYLPHTAPVAAEAVEFQWAGHTARSIGTVIHRILHYLTEGGPHADPAYGSGQYKDMARAALRGFGISGEALDAALEQVGQALRRIEEDPRWRWISDPGHRDARNEYPLTGKVAERLVNGVIDRTFVDAREDIRWIIDYKTGEHEGGDIPGFLDREAVRYRGQMERYGKLLTGREEARPLRAGLYFPLLGGWRAWGIGIRTS